MPDSHLRRRLDDQSWATRFRLWVVAFMACLVLIALYLFSVREYALHERYQKVLALEVEIGEMERRHQTQLAVYALRIDDLERTLFGDVLAKIEKQKPAPVQLWQRNRDNEIRARIQANEKRLMDMDTRVDRLEQK